MTKRLTDLVLHPVRMQIVRELGTGHHLTASQLQHRLPHIPQATLYRHLSKLVDAGAIDVVEERQVRSLVEKVYAIRSTTLGGPGAVFTPEEYIRFFMSFTANLTRAFEEYILQPEADPLKDNASFRTARLYATEEEFQLFMSALKQAYGILMKNPPSPERKGFDISTIFIPAVHNVNRRRKISND